jgi:hypothetical protein
MHCPRWSMSTMMCFYVFGVETFGNLSFLQSRPRPSLGGSVLLLPFGLHSRDHMYLRHAWHDMHTKMRWPPISSTAQTFFLPVVTLFTILSEFQRFHKTVFRRLIIHSLARRSAHSVRIAIHRLLCYITK